MTKPETRALHAVLIVTVTTRPDGGHYFDQADFAAHVGGWVRSALRDKHAVGEVAVVEAAAVSVPPPAPRADDQAALRDRIAEALIAWTYRGKDPEHGGILETVRANAYSRADAVLAVLPEPADRAAVLREAAEWFDSGIRSVSRMFGHQAATALRRMADEAQPARLDRCPHGCDTSTCPCLACEADEVEQPDGPCVAGEQQNETRHVCKPGASTYHCPTSGRTESDCHGGFTTCCDRPDLHHAPAVVAQPGKETQT